MADRRRHVRRIAIKAIVFLLLGAIINVAVAWGCAYWSELPADSFDPIKDIPPLAGPWSGKHGAPEIFYGSESLHVRAFGSSRRSLQAVSQKYNDAGVLVFWIDGKWINALDAPDFVSHRYSVIWYSVGWPCRSLQGGEWHIETHAIADPAPETLLQTGVWLDEEDWGRMRQNQWVRTFLPMGPSWPGFAYNTLLYAGALWLLLAAPLTLRSWRRKRRSGCRKCGYPIGNSPICTECGAALRKTSPGHDRAGAAD